MESIDPEHGGLRWASSHLDVNRDFNPVPSNLPLAQKVRRSLSIAQECIQPQQLQQLLATKQHPICYDGFEPSGRMHIAQGILKSINVNKLTSCGCIFVFWVADWFALLNNKMDGDLYKIQTVGKYMIQTWKAAGMDMRNVKFLWASEEINKRPNQYWNRVMDIARKNTITRMTRCSQIMGRDQHQHMPASQILYPCMQCSDIFFLNADICQLGMDQRKVNALAREYCDQIHRSQKPVILSHPMMMGLLKDQAKMSKSDPRSAIFMQDSREEVENKIKSAFCDVKDVENNPVLNYVKHIIFDRLGSFEIKRTEANGGDKIYGSFAQLEGDYASGALHPGDLKPAVAKAINAMLDPIRRHFEEDEYARALFEEVRSFSVTR